MKKLICLALLAALWLPAAVSLSAAPSTSIVISEFRARGPSGGNDEFIELHNLSSEPVPIGGWKVKGSNNTGGGTTTPRATIPAGVIVPAGCFYLLTNNGAAGYSGPVPGNLTYGTGITDDGGIAITRPDDSIVDQVGMSTGSAFKEGTVLASLGSSNQNRGYERKPGGAAGHAQDTDNNAADFQLLAPSNPQNAGSPCIGATDPAIDANGTPNPIIQFETLLVTGIVTGGSKPVSTGLAATADLAALGGANGQSLFDDGSNGDQNAGDGIYSYSLAVTASPGTYPITARVTDAQGRSGQDVFSVTVQPVPPLLLPHQVQGDDTESDYVTQVVTVEGVVTARRSNGVFIETEAGREDGIPQTSEGLFVFTRSAPPASASVGTLIRATGPVEEFSGDGNAQTQTEIAWPTGTSPAITPMGTASVSAPTLISAADLTPDGGFEQFERFEGMRIFAPSLTTISGTEGFFATATGGEASGVATSSGVFYAVLTSTPRPSREEGLDLPLKTTFENSCESGPPCAIPIFDFNPERLRVDSDALGAPRLDVTSNVRIQNVTAIVDSGFITWNLLPVPNALPVPVVGPNMMGTGVTAAPLSQFTVASFNVQRFFDTRDDSGISDVKLTAENYEARLTKASLVIRESLHAPDVIAVQEVENVSVLQDLATRISADLGLPGEYTAYLEEGNDPGGIDVGFLVRSRVHVTSVTQEGKDTTFTDPDDGSIDDLNDRPPLVLRAVIDGPSTMLDANVIVVANHLRSLGGVELANSKRVRVKRQLQAEFLAELLDDLQEEGPVISVGDYNAFEKSDGLVDVMGTVRGAPAPANTVVLASDDLVEPDFVEAAPGTYSYVFEGNVQALDHVLLSSEAQELFVQLQHARLNSDFPEIYRNDATRVERLSDHDPAVAYFSFPPDLTPPSIAAVTPSTTTLWPANHRMESVSITVEADDNLGLNACLVTNVSSNEPDNAAGDGSTADDWSIDGALTLSLRAERSGTGSGRIYTITVTCEDVAGNTTTATTSVTVPHSQGGKKK